MVGVESDKVVVDGVEAKLSGEVEVRVVGQVHRGGLSRQGLCVKFRMISDTPLSKILLSHTA